MGRSHSCVLLILLQIWAGHGEDITKSSLTFVIDDTASMYQEISQVKDTVNTLFDTVTTSDKSQIENFVLVTFNDPGAELLTVTKDRAEFKIALRNINIHGGGDCPENSMKGIKIGLENSLPLSYLYVFTDASAADYSYYEEIKSISQKKQIQITFLLTGECGSRSDADYQVYHKLAAATSGQVFNMMKQDIKDVLDYVVETVKGRDSVLVYKTLPPGEHDVEFEVDKKMDDVTIAVAGSDPSIKVKDPGGKEVETTELVDKHEIKIVNVPKGESGVYTAKTGSTSDKSVRITGKTTLNFKHGFTSYKPLTLKETATRPVPDGNTHLSIQLVGEGVLLHTAKILDPSDNVLQELPLKLINEKEQFYVTEEFNPPNTAFKVSVLGYEVETKSPVERISPTLIERQNPMHETTSNIEPMVKILEGPKVSLDYNEPIELKCRINGYPKPDVLWVDIDTGTSQRTDVVMIEAPSDFVSTLKIEKVNKDYTYECQATNALGKSVDRIEVTMKTYFKVLEKPEVTTDIEYGKEGRIPCVVEALPPPIVTWYKDGAPLSTDHNLLISTNNNIVTIKSMNIQTQGTYMCEIRNELNRKVFYTKVSVVCLEKPKIDKSKEIVPVPQGEDAVLECRILEGIPPPKIQWYFDSKHHESFEEIHETTEILKIPSVERDQDGTYLCIASNELGSERYAVDLVVEYPPIIKESSNKIQALDGDIITVPCEVEGVPSPTVKWFKDGKPISTSSDFEITANHDLQWRGKVLTDNGDYTCEAENAHGSDRKTVTVDIIDLPRIEVPEVFTIATTVGKDIILPCQADGHPRPDIKWIYNDFNGKITRNVGNPKNSMVLNLSKLKQTDQGYYTCEASNIGGSARITYKVEVNAPPVIQNTYSDKNFKVVRGDLMLKIKCIATGSPEPTIEWKKDHLNIAFGTKWYDIDNGTLIIKNIDRKSQGLYTCLAKNKIGKDSMKYDVTVTDYPLIDGPVTKIFAAEGEVFNIPCDIPHTGIDTVRWYKDHKLIGKGKLTLRRASKKNIGIYSCRVSDFDKSTSAHVHLSVGKKPEFLTEEETEIDFIEGDSVPLICEATGDPELKVSWRLNGEEIDVTEMIYDLNMMLDNRGVYTCEISNDFGTIQRSFSVVAQDCIFDINKDFMKDNAPLLLSSSLKWPSFDVFDGNMFINRNAPLSLHCQKGFSDLFSGNTVVGLCVSETNILVNNKVFKYTDITCKGEIEPFVKRSSIKCRGENTEYLQVGYQIYDDYLNVFDVCVDKKNKIPLFTRHKLSSEQNNVDKDVKRWFRNELLDLDFESMYECRKQNRDISSQLARVFHPYDECCFGKRQLVNPKDLRIGVPTAAVYNYLNVVPHWSTCNTKNWDTVEEKVRSFSKSFDNALTIYTGTANRRPGLRSRSYNRITLNDLRGGKQPVAQYLWKVVQDPVSSRSLAIIQVNHPDLSPEEARAFVHCRDICNRVEWMRDSNWHNVADGYTYCCSILDFESAFNFRGQFSRDKTDILYDSSRGAITV